MMKTQVSANNNHVNCQTSSTGNVKNIVTFITDIYEIAMCISYKQPITFLLQMTNHKYTYKRPITGSIYIHTTNHKEIYIQTTNLMQVQHTNRSRAHYNRNTEHTEPSLFCIMCQTILHAATLYDDVYCKHNHGR